MKSWQRQYAEDLIQFYKRRQHLWKALCMASAVLLYIGCAIYDLWWPVDVLCVWNLYFSAANYGRMRTLREKAEDVLTILEVRETDD